MVWRRIALYTGAVAFAVCAQAVVVFALRVPNGIVYCGFVFAPLLTALVYACVWADTAQKRPPQMAVWERALERSWAVILIDLAVSFVQITGAGGFRTGDLSDAFIGLAILIMSATFVFADASATLDEMPVWWLVPGALWRSVQACLNGIVFGRAITIVALSIACGFLQDPIYALLQSAHVANADFWASIPLDDATVPPIAALTALVYRDATRPAGERGAEAS